MDNFPRGKLTDDDEGELSIGIGVRDKTIVVNFFKPVAWFGLDKATALTVAAKLTELAEQI